MMLEMVSILVVQALALDGRVSSYHSPQLLPMSTKGITLVRDELVLCAGWQIPAGSEPSWLAPTCEAAPGRERALGDIAGRATYLSLCCEASSASCDAP